MNKPPARGRGAAQLGTGEPRLEDENPEEAVERSGEGSARAGGESWVAADSSPMAKKRHLPNTQPRGQSQMSSDARGGSSRDFTGIATAQRLRGSKRLPCADGMRFDQEEWSRVASLVKWMPA